MDDRLTQLPHEAWSRTVSAQPKTRLRASKLALRADADIAVSSVRIPTAKNRKKLCEKFTHGNAARNSGTPDTPVASRATAVTFIAPLSIGDVSGR